jgi:hypothetical protein
MTILQLSWASVRAEVRARRGVAHVCACLQRDKNRSGEFLDYVKPDRACEIDEDKKRRSGEFLDDIKPLTFS